MRPLDYDNYAGTKQIQDLLVTAGLLPGDAWNQLEGLVRSRKADDIQSVKTEIEIEEIKENT